MRTKRTIGWVAALGVLVPACAYLLVYFLVSSVTREPIPESSHSWTIRSFGDEWQISLFKPLLWVEDVCRDGDFSYEIQR